MKEIELQWVFCFSYYVDIYYFYNKNVVFTYHLYKICKTYTITFKAFKRFERLNSLQVTPDPHQKKKIMMAAVAEWEVLNFKRHFGYDYEVIQGR